MLRVGPRLRVAQRRSRELARQEARRAVARQGGGGYQSLGALERPDTALKVLAPRYRS